jgi:hypothetical protein
VPADSFGVCQRQAHRLDADLNPRRIFAGGDRDGRDVELAAGVGP